MNDIDWLAIVNDIYFLPTRWQAYNKYNAKNQLVPYHICPKHKIFKRR